MPDNTSPEAWPLPELTRARRAIVVVDVVESVRLMQEDEAGFIGCWRRFVNEVATQVLPTHGGRLVKSLGDGLLLEFENVPAAVAAALDMQRRIPAYNAEEASDAAIHLRIGVHVAEVVVDALDVYGAGVNLAARLAGLGGPGEVVASAEVRREIAAGLDAEIEDLGDCYLKHIERSVRAFRVAPKDQEHGVALLRKQRPLRPTLVVMPLRSLAQEPQVHQLAQALSDDLVAAASASHYWTVLSRLTTQVLGTTSRDAISVGDQLRADYVLSGTVRKESGRAQIHVEAHEVVTARSVFCCSYAASFAQPFAAFGDTTIAIVNDLADAVLRRQLLTVHAAALPNLPGYALLLRAIALVHSLGREDMRLAHDALEYLHDRHPRSAEAKAWLAKWYFLQIAQKNATDGEQAVTRARGLLARALDEQPAHALSLAIAGHLCAFVDGDLTSAESTLQQAAQAGPNEPLAWLYLSNVLTARDRGLEAIAAVNKAAHLSPVDPLSYSFDFFAASAYSAAGKHDEALPFAERSVRHNGLHLSGLVQLIVEQVLTGHMDQARRTAQRYLQLRPNASVRRFMENHTARATRIAEREGAALLEAGLPL